MEMATFAAGCFWGIEAAFRRLPGVTQTSVGYTGGDVVDPGYKRVCGGDTGHAEAVRVSFDPGKIGYEQLLEVFWAIHDPSQMNRQGPDVGTQYRSAIFTHSPEQDRAARASLARLAESSASGRPIVTEIVPAGPYYLAEDYHQQYLEKRGQAACRVF
jgi:peptide-methionine (S)-S-oxide reductase